MTVLMQVDTATLSDHINRVPGTPIRVSRQNNGFATFNDARQMMGFVDMPHTFLAEEFVYPIRDANLTAQYVNHMDSVVRIQFPSTADYLYAKMLFADHPNMSEFEF